MKVVDCRKRDDKAIQEQLKEADVGDGIWDPGPRRDQGGVPNLGLQKLVGFRLFW